MNRFINVILLLALMIAYRIGVSEKGKEPPVPERAPRMWSIRYASDEHVVVGRSGMMTVNGELYVLVPIRNFLGMNGYVADSIDETNHQLAARFNSATWQRSPLRQLLSREQETSAKVAAAASLRELNRQVTQYNGLVDDYNNLLDASHGLYSSIERIVPYFDYQLQFQKQLLAFEPVLSSYGPAAPASQYTANNIQLAGTLPSPPDPTFLNNLAFP